MSKPARYIGGEQGAVYPEHGPGKVAWLLIYPDTYEIGLPNQGLQILYEILNGRPDALAERTYAPWVDMEAAMRAAGVPLFSVEQHLPAAAFDVLAFNLSAELVYTNVVNLIDLAGLPLHAADRGGDDALVIAGGHCAFNPEPLADFVDAFVLGDGEEAVGEVNEVVAAWSAGAPPGQRDRAALLRSLARLEGVYVPALYTPAYEGGRLMTTSPAEPGVPATVHKRTVSDLAEWPYPSRPLVPLTEVVHDRLNVEVFRGCTRGCRFCQAGMITRPVRERPAAQVREMVRDGLEWSGYEEVTLTSLSTADFSDIEDTVRDIVDDPEHGGRVSVSLPSLRVDAFTVGTAAQIQKVRRTGLTFAPEGGTWRMRTVINKLITEEDLYGAVDAAFSQGWRRVKLYFLIGLPTERDEDVLGIAELGARCVEIGKRYQKSVNVVASVGGFVPKAHTPFQWFGQDTVAELERKVVLLREAARRAPGADHPLARTRRLGRGRAGQPRRPAHGRGDRAGVAGRRHLPGVVRALRPVAVGVGPRRRGPERGRGLSPRAGRRRGAAVGPHLGRSAPGLPLGRLAGRAGPGGGRGLPLDPVLRLRRLHRGRARAHRGVAAASGRGQPGNRTGPAGGGPHPGPPGQSCLLRGRGACACVSPNSARSVSRAIGTWPGCGSGRCGAAGCPSPIRRGSCPTPWSASGSPCPPVASRSGSTSTCGWGRPKRGRSRLPTLPAALSGLLPEGIDVTAAALVEEAEGSLQQEVGSCDWELEVLGVPGEVLQEQVEKLLAAPILTVRRERKGRQAEDDIRPAILALSVTSPNGHLEAELATHPRGVRPGDLVAALGTDVVLGRACRTHQWIERDGARFEPLPLGGPGTGVGATQHARRAFPHVRDGNQPDPGGSPPGGSGRHESPCAARRGPAPQAEDR